MISGLISSSPATFPDFISLTRILSLYVRIVKLRQNFTKMREFSQIRDEKKIMVKIIIVYEIRLYSPNGNIAGFQHQLLKPNQNCLLPYQCRRQSKLSEGELAESGGAPK